MAESMNDWLRAERARKNTTAGYAMTAKGLHRRAALAASYEPNPLYDRLLGLRESDPALWARLAPATQREVGEYEQVKALHQEEAGR